MTHAPVVTMSHLFTLSASAWLCTLAIAGAPASAQPPPTPTPARLAFEPATAAFVEEVGRQPPTEGLTLEQLREGYRQTVIRNSVPADMRVAVRNDTVAGLAGAVPVRLYTPQAAVGRTSGLLLYVYGGGFAVGDLDSHDRLLRLIASELGHRVLALGGESAGGTHATAAAMAVRDRQLGPLKALWLLVPALDAQTRGTSYTTFATGAGRTATEFAYLWSLYVPDVAQRGLPGPSPLYASAAGLPKTFVYTAEFDPARDDGESFAKKLEAAGGQVTLQRQKGLVHQFPEITGLSPASRQAVVDAARALAGQLR